MTGSTPSQPGSGPHGPHLAHKVRTTDTGLVQNPAIPREAASLAVDKTGKRQFKRTRKHPERGFRDYTMKILGFRQPRENTRSRDTYANCGKTFRNLHRPNPTSKSEAGQELVEFALIFALLILFIFGILDLGRLFFTTITIVNSAREGARYAMLYPDDLPGIIAATQLEAAGSGIDLTDPGISSISVSCPPAAPPPPVDGCLHGEPVRVTVSYIFDPIMNWLFPVTITLTRYAEMVTP